jgi:hypothetical protein
MGSRLCGWEGGWGRCLTLAKVTGSSQLCVLFFSGSLIGGSHVYIVSVFLSIPALGP